MDDVALRALLEKLSRGEVDVATAEREIGWMPFRDLGFAKVDHHRALRQGVPEVVFGERKTEAEILAVVGALVEAKESALVTRVETSVASAILRAHPAAIHNARARTVRLSSTPRAPTDEKIAIVTAGTSDLPVAEETSETLLALGVAPRRYDDVGVAGIHRLMKHGEALREADVVIAIAGMEGALASVVGGLVACPVVAVPTSVGYGTSLGGFTALFAMLTSCASGVSVVNIDNGFGGAMAAHRILSRLRARDSQPRKHDEQA